MSKKKLYTTIYKVSQRRAESRSTACSVNVKLVLKMSKLYKHALLKEKNYIHLCTRFHKDKAVSNKYSL